MTGDGTEKGRPVMLIAGGSGSIGVEIARQAMATGWDVALHGRTETRLDTAVAELAAGVAEAQIESFRVDLTDAGSIQGLVASVGERFGRIDAVIDCTTGGPPGVVGLFKDTDPDAYAGLLEASLGRLQRLAHAALPWLASGGGTLVAFASDAGRFAAARQSLIGASRAGIMGFVRNLAMEAARDGVRVHCVSPSFVDGSASIRRIEAGGSDRIAKARGRAGLGLPTAADIAPLVIFLCSDGARRITGEVISVNGGLNA